MIRGLFGLLMVLVLASAFPSVSAQSSFGYTIVRIPEGFGTIMGKGLASDAFPEAEGHWVPSVDDVYGAEDVLLEVREPVPHRVQPGPSVQPYEVLVRQYYGLVEDGTEILYVNGFCESWMRSEIPIFLYQVDDGGACYWHARIDSEKWEIISYTENGQG